MDREQRFLWVNEAAAQPLGVTPSDVVGTHVSDWYPAVADRYRAADLRLFQSGRSELGRVERIELDGTEVVYETDRHPILQETGEIQGILALARDVTDREAVREHVLEAERAQTLGELAAHAAHDLGNLLMIMTQSIEERALGLDPASPTDLRTTIAQARLITRQLGLIAVDQDPSEAFSLPELVADALRLVRPGVPTEVRVETDFAPAPTRVRCDPGQLLRIATNLVLNASEAMPDGGALTISTRERLDLGFAELQVRDTGCGIPEEVRARLFRQPVTTKAEGTGIGLLSCQELVRRMGGELSFTSFDDGTSFTVRLPLASTDTGSA